MRHPLLKTLAIGLGLFMAAIAFPARSVVVGSTNFPEQLILANIYANVLEAEGIEVEKRLNLGSREIVYPALVAGEIDILPEYTGALLAHVSEGQEIPAHEEQAVIKALREALPESIVMLEASSAQDKDALVVRPETAQEYGLETFSDLAPVAGELIMGGPPEFKTRRVGLPGLKDVYGIEFKAFRSLDAGGPVTVGALKNGAVDVANMFTTQGIIDAMGWVVLEDDKQLNPAQNVVPVVRSEVLNDTIREALNKVSRKLDTETLQMLNRQVGVDKRDPADVAAQWLSEQ